MKDVREIFFRGKRIYNGEWVEGCYMKDEKDLSTAYIGYILGVDGETVHDMDIVKVDPETVGQYTGLTDKNGRKIFCGDIVKVTDTDWKNQVFGIGDISFKEGSWRIGGDIQENLYWVDDVISYEFEIIGNIFDNPELIDAGGRSE